MNDILPGEKQEASPELHVPKSAEIKPDPVIDEDVKPTNTIAPKKEPDFWKEQVGVQASGTGSSLLEKPAEDKPSQKEDGEQEKKDEEAKKLNLNRTADKIKKINENSAMIEAEEDAIKEKKDKRLSLLNQLKDIESEIEPHLKKIGELSKENITFIREAREDVEDMLGKFKKEESKLAENLKETEKTESNPLASEYNNKNE